jgi:hypothetical protein
MDMNNGADYTKYQEWKCAQFSPSGVPANWYMYDYDDSLWEVSKTYGMNYQNNSYQIYYTERLGIHLNAEWLWTQNNAKTNVFCRKKDKHVQTIPLQTTTLFHPTPTTAAPTTHTTIHASVLKPTHHIPAQTAAPTTHAPIHASVLKTTHHIPAQTAAPPTHASVLKTTHHIPAQTAAPTTHATTHANVLKPTHHIPVQTAAPTTHASVLKTTHHVPAQTAAPTTHATTHASVLKTTHHVPAQTAAPTTHASVLKTIHHISEQTATPTTHATTHASGLKTTHHIPAQSAAPLVKPEIQNIYNIKNTIKIIINNAKVSKNIVDNHMFTIFRYLHSLKTDRNDRNDDRSVNDEKLRRELYTIVKQTHTHIHNHYNQMFDYYKNLLRDKHDNEGSGEYEKEEKEEKVDNKKRLHNSSTIIKSMIKLNHYIKVIEYKIQFIKGETKYNLLKILYSLRKQYQDDMTQMLKFL